MLDPGPTHIWAPRPTCGYLNHMYVSQMVPNVFRCVGTCVFDDLHVEKVVENVYIFPKIFPAYPYFFLPRHPVGAHPGTTPPPPGGGRYPQKSGVPGTHRGYPRTIPIYEGMHMYMLYMHVYAYFHDFCDHFGQNTSKMGTFGGFYP